MLVNRRQLESLANRLDGMLDDCFSKEHSGFVEEIGRFADNASGGDLHTFVQELKYCLELKDAK